MSHICIINTSQLAKNILSAHTPSLLTVLVQVAELDSMRKLMCVLRIKAFKPILVVTQNKIMNAFNVFRALFKSEETFFKRWKYQNKTTLM